MTATKATALPRNRKVGPKVRAEAKRLYLDSLAAGYPISGAELGRRFGCSDRWGREQARGARDALPGDFDAPEGNQPEGNHGASLGTGSNGRSAPSSVPASRTNGTTPGSRGLPSAMVTPAADAVPSPVTVRVDVDEVETSTNRPSWLDTVAMLVVALVAAAASYGHMYEVATMAGENVWIARLFPITVDGLVLIAIRRGREGRWWLAVGIAVSIAANVAAAQPSIEGRLVAAWPPLSLLGAHRLLHSRSR